MKFSRTVGAGFLIAGTSIGAGMLALPVAMAGAGFYPSLLLLIVCWAVLFYSGLLVVEANINLERGANFISMSRATLGTGGEATTWAVYLLLLYSLIAAYLTGSADLLHQALLSLFKVDIAEWLLSLPFILVVTIVICAGTKFVDYLGRILLFGLIIGYAVLVTIALPHIDTKQLMVVGHSYYLFSALPIVAAAFGYHITIPSLRAYLHDDVAKIKWAIFIGSTIPLFVYIVWELIIFGIIPIAGAHGLLAILHSGNPASRITSDLAMSAKSYWLPLGAKFFVIFAIASSFLGVTFSLFDFLADGLKIEKNFGGKAKLTALTFIPPFAFMLFYPKGFILALSFAGIFVAILHGILPALMVWSGRKDNKEFVYKVKGGKVALIAIMIFSILIIMSQLVR
jgi:tyrosine-specific transport protein